MSNTDQVINERHTLRSLMRFATIATYTLIVVLVYRHYQPVPLVSAINKAYIAIIIISVVDVIAKYIIHPYKQY